MYKNVLSVTAIVALGFVCFYPRTGRTDAGPNCHTVSKANTKDAVECPAGEKVRDSPETDHRVAGVVLMSMNQDGRCGSRKSLASTAFNACLERTTPAS